MKRRILTGRVVHDVATMERAATTLLRFGAGAVLIKGGHLSAGEIVDILATPSGIRRFTHPRIETTSTHGTGCTLSAAITAGLALGRPLEDAVADGAGFRAPRHCRGSEPRRRLWPAQSYGARAYSRSMTPSTSPASSCRTRLAVSITST